MSILGNRFNNASPLTPASLLATGHIGFQLKRLNWLRPELPHTTAFKHRIISVYIHEQYLYGTEEDANVVRFRPKIRVQFSRSPWEDIRFLSYVRIYIIMERKEGFLSFTDSIPLSNAKIFYSAHFRDFYLEFSSNYIWSQIYNNGHFISLTEYWY